MAPEGSRQHGAVARRLERWTLRHGRRCAATVQNAWRAVPRWATRTAPGASLGLA